MKTDLYQRVTDQIVAQLEAGVKPWVRPWNAKHAEGRITRPLRVTGEAYQGINVMMLWGAAADRGYTAPTWMTYRQATELGAQVRKGETASLVVFASKLTRTEENAGTGEEATRHIPFLKSYMVFNAEQIDGLPERFTTPALPCLATVERIDRVERFIAGTGATIRHGGNRAAYAPGLDMVQMPPIEAFRDAESYYGTLTHELTHWTGHPKRLDRSFGKRFADKAYAVEELVAEMGAAFLSADLDLTPAPRDDHADYLGHWLSVLKADKRAIFTAASQAQRAADFLTGARQQQQEAA